MEDMIAAEVIRVSHSSRIRNVVFGKTDVRVELTEYGSFLLGQIEEHKLRMGTFDFAVNEQDSFLSHGVVYCG